MIHNTCNFIGSNEVTAVFPFIKFEITDQQSENHHWILDMNQLKCSNHNRQLFDMIICWFRVPNFGYTCLKDTTTQHL